MNQEYKLYRISQLLSRFREQVKILNSNGEFSINIHAENILIKILNQIYGCDLTNVNYEERKNYPSIDLRDTKNKIAFQITSTGTLGKVKSTIRQFKENKFHEKFDRLYMFVISDKQKKYEQEKIDEIVGGEFVFMSENILDRTDIYLKLNEKNDINQISIIEALLEEQFADNANELSKWDKYCKGLNEYDSYISNLYQYLDIKGFSPKINSTQVKIKLSDIYVPLELNLEGDFDEEGKEKKVYSIEDALFNFGRIVVLGDPGSGKSTVLKNLAYKICSDRCEIAEFSDLLPFIIKGSEFAKFVSRTSKGVGEFLVDHISKQYENLIAEKLESNELLLLVDGIDEINNVSLRHQVVDKINSFISQYSELKVVVSSRIVGYKETRLNGYFNHLNVKRFNKDQIQHFVKNWYSAVESESTEKAKEKAKELFNSISQNQSVLKMASNPLLVTIIALIHFQGNKLPERRASLYDIATTTFLENWVRQREKTGGESFDKETIVEILAPTSFYIHENNTTGLISESNLKAQLRQEYEKVNPFIDAKSLKIDLREIIEFLRQDAGFLFEKGLNEEGESMFGYVHQTFQEYFTAIEFKTRWKEGMLKDSLGEYLFKSNWREVIKLTASLFKLNEQSRLGRKDASRFIKDILTVEDPFPEMMRPLQIVLEILSEDTEVEFDQFREIVDVVFSNFLSIEDDHENDSYNRRELYMFKNLIEELLDSRTYQKYLIQRIMEDLGDEKRTPTYKKNLIYMLMSKSKSENINDALQDILKSKNEELKRFMFEYNVVFPVAPVVKTDGFRDQIVGYINSNTFIKNYTGRVPTQYVMSFERTENMDIEEYIRLRTENIDIEESIMNERLESIRVVKDKKIRVDLINYYVFSIGLGSLNNVQRYYERIKEEYPSLQLTKIQKRIEEMKERDALNIEDFPIFRYRSVQIFRRKDEVKELLLMIDDKVEVVSYPIKERELIELIGKENKDILTFFLLVLPWVMEKESYLVIKNLEQLVLVMKNSKKIHWYHNDFSHRSNVHQFALESIFKENDVVNMEVLNWVLEGMNSHERRVVLNDDFEKSEFFRKVNQSSLPYWNKLFLTNLVGEWSDYEDLVRPTIESIELADNEEEKDKIKSVLYDVL
jgi:adenylate kinase family enzyme